MQVLRKWMNSRWMLGLALAISFLIPYLFFRNAGGKEPQYDSWVYTQLSQVFQQKGLFHFRDYALENGGAYRGYLLPWLIALGEATSRLSPLLDYGFWVSLMCAATCALAVPALMESVFRIKASPFRRVWIAGLFTLLFQGLLLYALSDLWAAGFGIMAMAALLRAVGEEPKPLWSRILWSLGCGVCLGAAYNIRTIYLLLWGVAALVIGVYTLRRQGAEWRARLLWLPAMALGLGLISLPQIISNAIVYQSASPLLMSEEGSSLFTYQLYNGIYEQKFESNIGVDYWEETVDYADDAGMLICNEEGLEPTFEFNDGTPYFESVGEYVELALRHPLDFLGVYGRHLINMMDMRYPEIYVETMQPNPLYPAVNYLALYLSLAALGIYVLKMEKGKLGRLWIFAAALLPAVAIAAGAVEPRFGVSVHLLLWGCLTCLPSRKMLATLRVRDWVLLGMGAVLFFCGMTAVGGQTLAGFEDLPLLYQ